MKKKLKKVKPKQHIQIKGKINLDTAEDYFGKKVKNLKKHLPPA